MLETFAESVRAWASGTLRSQAESDFLAVQKELAMTSMVAWADEEIRKKQNSETSVITIPEQVITFWLELIGKQRKTPKTSAVPAVYPAYALPAASPVVQNVPAEQPAPEAASDDITKRAEQIEAEINQTDSFEELENMVNSSFYEDSDEDSEELEL